MNKYRIIVTYSEEKQAYLARIPELNECLVEAPTATEAVTKLEEELFAQIDNMRNQGIEPPEPVEGHEFDGQLSLKTSSALHREIAFLAKAENMEISAMAAELLSRGLAHYWQPRGSAPRRSHEGHGQERGRGSNRYHGIMENRADFIEYVRSLEGGGNPRGGGRNQNRGRR